MPLTADDNYLGSVRDIYLFHGWGMHSGFWGTLPERLRGDGFRPHPLDLPGHGNAPPLPQMDLPTLTRALAARIDTPGYLIGWSLGGLLALDIARAFPDRVTGLALTGVSPCFVVRPDWRHGMAPDTFASFREHVRNDPGHAMSWFLGLQIQGSAHERRTLRELRRILAETRMADANALLAGLDILENHDLRPRLGDVGVPVTIIHGARDGLVPVAAAEALRSGMPNARIELIDEAGHAPFLSHAELFYAALRGEGDV
ncbi:MAG: pimeloyl-ACP methyl ester esterase BioH [Gammaproteobacteria bacterium]|nr:pimeloyl-ACP methyl ester esterase BioH [Gammaproteobacteria bacterium]